MAAPTLTALAALALFSSLTASASAAKSPAPLSPLVTEGASIALYVPNPQEALPAVSAFLARTAQDSALLSPKSAQGLLSPSLPPGANPLDASSLTASGIDTSRPITFSKVGGQWVACFSALKGQGLADGELAASEKGMGLIPASLDDGPFRLSGASLSDGTWKRGAISFGNFTCTARGERDVRKALQAAKSALSPAPKSPASPLTSALERTLRQKGPADSQAAHHIALAVDRKSNGIAAAVFSPDSDEPSLGVRGLIQGKAAELFAASSAAKKRPSSDGLPLPPDEGAALWLDVRLSEAASSRTGEIASTIQRLLRHGAPDIPTEEREALKRLIVDSMTGRAALAVSGTDAKAPKGSVHQIRQALFAQVSRPQELSTMIEALAPKLTSGSPAGTSAAAAAALTPHGFSAILEGVRVWFGVEGDFFYFTNDRALAAKALAAPKAAPSPLAPPKMPATSSLRLVLDGKEAANALKRVSMFDMAAGDLFATLFAAKMDLSGLIEKSGTTELTAASGKDGTLTFEADLNFSGKCRPCQAAAKARAQKAAAGKK